MHEKEEKFVNEPSRRMYKALTELISKTGLTPKDVAEKFEKYERTPRNYFNALLNGTISVTVDQILRAKEFFGIDPCKLFTDDGGNKKKQLEEKNEWILKEEESLITKGKPQYGKDISALIRLMERQEEHFMDEIADLRRRLKKYEEAENAQKKKGQRLA